MTKLTEEQILDIKKLIADGEDKNNICSKYEISKTTLNKYLKKDIQPKDTKKQCEEMKKEYEKLNIKLNENDIKNIVKMVENEKKMIENEETTNEN